MRPAKSSAAPRSTPEPRRFLQAVVFSLEGQRYALPLEAVTRIVRAVEVTPLPGAPPVVLGAIDVEGRILPVLDIRMRFGLQMREIDPSQQFVIATAGRRTVVLVVDESHGLIEFAQSDLVGSSAIAPGAEHFEGMVRLGDGLALLHDLEKFLSLDECRLLDESMGGGE